MGARLYLYRPLFSSFFGDFVNEPQVNQHLVFSNIQSGEKQKWNKLSAVTITPSILGTPLITLPPMIDLKYWHGYLR